jgi:hypothetical protein
MEPALIDGTSEGFTDPIQWQLEPQWGPPVTGGSTHERPPEHPPADAAAMEPPMIVSPDKAL